MKKENNTLPAIALIIGFIAFTTLVYQGCITTPPQLAVKSPSTSVLVIGVENGYAGKCDGALVDAYGMKSLLSKYTSDLTFLVDDKATRQAVRAAIGKIITNELAIIYYSGHGGSKTSTDPFEVDGKDEYLCLYDQPLLDNDIWDLISGSTNRVMLMFDCCHSQTMFKTPIVPSLNLKALSVAASMPPTFQMLCWSGCLDSQYSYGSSNGGFFTNLLIRKYNPSKTYKQMIDEIIADENVKKHQTISCTTYNDFDMSLTVFK